MIYNSWFEACSIEEYHQRKQQGHEEWEEEKVALASKGPSQRQVEKKKKKDMSKVKYFKCGELGH